MQPSRRAFLFGRQTPRTPWDAFLQRLERVVQGRVQRFDGEGRDHARLLPIHREDVRQARAMCAEFGITLRLDRSVELPGGAAPVLDIDPSSLNTLTRVEQTDQWLAEPGCRVGDLVAAGLPQFRDAPSEWSLAAWLATTHGWAIGETAASGVESVEILLSDGTAETLGAFGAADQRPLRSVTVQRLVPALFQLSQSPDATICRQAQNWPCPYRLDALLPKAPAEVNLAQLLLGHGAELAWVESVTLIPGASTQPAYESSTSDVPHVPGAQASSFDDNRPAPEARVASSADQVASAARRLQIRMKQAFDPLDLYGS